MSASAQAVTHSRDVVAGVATEAFKPKRHGKRKKPASLVYQRRLLSLGRTWPGFSTFSLVATLLIALAVGTGATAGLSAGATGVEVAMHAVGTGGLLANAAWQSELPPRSSRPRSDEDGRVYSPGLSSALASVESFAFDGKVAVTAYERYKKDEDGGWIWGNSMHLNAAQRVELQAVVRKRKHSAFAYSMEDLPGYHGSMGPFRLELDTDKAIVQPPRHYSPAEQQVIREKTCFGVGNQLMAYRCMPYGLRNAPAHFQRVMDTEIALAGLDNCAIAFIDDVLIWSESPDQHVKDVAAVLDMLHGCGLRAHPDKSIFGADVIEYLGHNLSTFGISPHQAKVAAIMALPPPKNVSELRTQLGFLNYYRAMSPI